MARKTKSRSPVFRRYTAIRQMCYNPNNKDYPRVGARGITCHWDNSHDFDQYVLKNLGLPQHGYQSLLTRIDESEDYKPGNLQWTTRKEISNNTSRNIYFTWNKKTQTMTQWADHFGINRSTIYSRYKNGWTFREMFITQARKK